MKLMNELLGMNGLEEAKKPKCTCEEDKATCKVHAKVQESAEYEGSDEFTEAWLDAGNHLKKALEIYEDPRFAAWLKVTDENYDTECLPRLKAILDAFGKLEAEIQGLDEQIDQADNG